jgi:hypothetical protein
MLMNHRVELRRGSAASCTSPGRSRCRFRRQSRRHLRHYRCLHFGQGTEMRAGTADNDAAGKGETLVTEKQ